MNHEERVWYQGYAHALAMIAGGDDEGAAMAVRAMNAEAITIDMLRAAGADPSDRRVLNGCFVKVRDPEKPPAEPWATTLDAAVLAATARWGPPTDTYDGRRSRHPLDVQNATWRRGKMNVRIEADAGRLMLSATAPTGDVIEIWHLAGRPWTDEPADVPTEEALDAAEAWTKAHGGDVPSRPAAP